MSKEHTKRQSQPASRIMKTYRVSYTQEIEHWIDVDAVDEVSAITKAMTSGKDEWDAVSSTGPAFQVEPML